MGFVFVHVSDRFQREVVRRLSAKVAVSHVFTCYPEMYSSLGRKRIAVVDSKVLYGMESVGRFRLSRELGADVLDEYKDLELLFYKLVDRFFHEPVSINRQKMYYLKLLSYFIDFFGKEKVSGVYFEATPHQGWDIILYHVAKRMGVKTFVLARTLIQDRMLLFEDYDHIEKAPPTSSFGSTKEELLRAIRDDELKEQTYKASGWIRYSDEVNRHVSSYSPLKVFSFIGKKIRKESLRVFLGKMARFMRRDDLRPISYPFLKKLALSRRHNRTNRRLKRYYQSRCEAVDYGKKYIFFGLHFQPERSTCPEGGVFENQLLAISVLSRSVGEGTTIYVKEHPRQVGRDFVNLRSPHFRSEEFYDDLLRMGNVKLVDIHADVNEIIRNSSAVSTVTGSVGWQGLLAGKPALVFGNPWYAGCRSCYQVESVRTCEKALAHIGRSSPEDVEKDVLGYLAHYQDLFFISSTNERFARESKKPYSLLVNNLVDELRKRLRKQS